MMPVGILCGGLGTRLAPLTDHVPKYLVDVNGRPFAHWQIELLRDQGYTDLVLLTGHFGEQIIQALGNGSELGVRIRYSHGPREGTAVAIRRALPLLGPEFFVLYGDSYLECDYGGFEALFEQSSADALLTFYEGVDYGLRAFRQYPPVTAVCWHMTQPFEEIGSHDGLAHLCATLSRRSRRDCLRAGPDADR